eukprot:CAMPEP_0174236238 /NCGR_PEP_ID=MMETSP0417-20130205/5427_1 /TAXON_ID=242541 /ORGANISM="Mayorella sp, Strain BSH-02190019" /LENGTH=719 /DNA_ID=CAMNT_0015314851 /DNA_START=111 /DNA_END=2266 /DNA_ORIENTATION=+
MSSVPTASPSSSSAASTSSSSQHQQKKTDSGSPPTPLNVHVGVLGHVDSGKTSLVKALSSKASTAAFDKSPQSRERQITLDLGFSAFYTPLYPPVGTPSSSSSSSAAVSTSTNSDDPTTSSVKASDPSVSSSDASSSPPSTRSSASTPTDPTADPTDDASDRTTSTKTADPVTKTSSSTTLPSPLCDLQPTEVDSLRARADGAECVQWTLVDCPGHASLIRTILGGAQLMDIMILLVDVTKGIQPQTGEGLVIGEIAMLHRWGRAGTAGRLVVVLNKMDVLPPSRRQTQLSKVRRALTGVLARTAFTANCPLIELSARPQLSPEHRTQLELALLRILASTGSHEAVGPSSSSSSSSSVLDPSSPSPSVTVSKTPASFVIAYDHCFQRKGSGAVLTGSVLSGRISVGDAICVPEIHATTASSSSAAATSTTASNKQNTYRVRSLQSFGRAVEFAERGARVGVCVSQGLPVQRLERGLAASPGRLHTVSAFISRIRRIRYFRSELRSGQLVHVTMGHTTKQAKLWFFDREAENLSKPFSLEDETFLAIDHLPPLTRDDPHAQVYTLFLFSQPVICSLDDLFLGSRLDMQDMSSCRLAFHGTILRVLERGEADLPLVGIYHRKLRQGKVSRVLGGSKSAKNSKDATGGRTASGGVCEVIGEGMFDRHTDISRFLRLQVHTRSGAQGTITAKFGSSGKFRATFEPSSSASSSTFASSAAAAAA